VRGTFVAWSAGSSRSRSRPTETEDPAIVKHAKNWSVALLLVLTIVVVLQNTETVETKLLFMTIAMPRALLLLITLASGVVIGLVLGARISALGRSPTV
jgi:uncharacterized integral membrane protein